MTTKKTTKKSRIRILLCAGQNGRCVLVGDVDQYPTPGQPVTLYNARMVLRWSAECGGLLGLAVNGPKTTTRITAAVPRTTETVWQEVCEVTAKAAEEIDKWPAC